MKFKLLAVAIGFGLCAAASAQPSGGFYLLKDGQSGKTVCSQTPISPDWVRQAGPFADAKCTVAQKPSATPQSQKLPANPLDLAPKK